MRAEPESQAEVVPAIANVSTNATIGTSQRTDNLPAMLCTACKSPCTAPISFCGTASSKESVATTYKIPDNSPPHSTALGTFRLGSSISSPITDASSSPTSPKQIKPNELIRCQSLARTLKSAACNIPPWDRSTPRARPTSTTLVIAVPIPPKLLIHFPTLRPRIFSQIITQSRTTDITATYTLSEPSICVRAPPA